MTRTALFVVARFCLLAGCGNGDQFIGLDPTAEEQLDQEVLTAMSLAGVRSWVRSQGTESGDLSTAP